MIKAKRIIFIAKTRMKHANILLSMYLSFVEMGYYVKDIDLLQHPGALLNPKEHMGGYGPVEINYEVIRQEIESFGPQIIILGAGGLTFTKHISQYLQNKGIILLGITLSDPDVLRTAKEYADRFSYHTTNSKMALEEYKKLGFDNTLYMPFGIDSRFFVPTEAASEHRCDVTIIGHFQPSRVRLTDEIIKRFNTKIFGSRWPYENASPIQFPEWLKAVHSGKIVVDFPNTRAGYKNVKVRLFEVAAAGTMLITQQLDEINDFFVFGKEIVGYTSENELYEKIEYYLKHPEERKDIARCAQLKCAEKHMWKNRFSDLFKQIGFE